MISGVNHLTFAVADLERSLVFYRDVLGLKLLMRWRDGAYLLAGDNWICLSLDPSVRTQPLAEYTHTAFTVSAKQFEMVRVRIMHGARLWRDDTSEGASLYFLDPDGHKLEIHVGDWRTRLAHYKTNPRPDFEFFV